MSEPDLDESPALVGILRELVNSDGWKWYCQQVDAAFGPAGIAKRLNVIRAEVPRGPGREFELAAKVDALYDAADAVNALIKKPKETVDSLTKKPDTRPFAQFRRSGVPAR